MACSSGMSPTTTTLARSQPMAMRRAPTRSISGPAPALIATSGASSAKATRPVLAGDPVVTSTSHGMAIIDSRVPTSEMASATR